MNNNIRGCRKIEDFNFFKKLVEERGYSVMDVRTPVAYRDGTLFNAPNAPLRNFVAEFIKTRRENNKIILVGSKNDTTDLEVSIKYANNVPDPDNKSTNMSYVFYEDMSDTQEKKKGS